MNVTLAQVAAISGALLSITGLFAALARWLDGRFEAQVKAVTAELEKAIEHGVNEAKTFAASEIVRHDDNAHAHPTHFMTPVIQGLQLEITRSLTEMRGEIKALSSEVASLRRAHDEAIARSACIYSQRECGGSER